MLAVSPARYAGAEDQRVEVAGGAFMEEVGGVMSDMEFDFTVDDIDFADFFLRLEDDDALPDLVVYPAEIFTDFEPVVTGHEEVRDQEVPSVVLSAPVADVGGVNPCGGVIVEENNTAFAGAGLEKGERNHAEKVVGGNGDVGGDDRAAMAEAKSPSSLEAESRHKSFSKHSQGKKKAKVDWTPELHRSFVQAVELLGIDKAVPSRILDIMGIDTLTRHNIASHLQKYRSHRKHMLAREAEAASWTQRRQMYAAGAGAAMKRPDPNVWTVPTIGLPPPAPPPAPPMQQFGRPLHVWGHPTMDSPRMPMWPRHLVPRAPTPPWTPPPPSDPAFWHPYIRGPVHMPTQGTSCMAMPMPAARFPAPPVPGVVPCPIYKPLNPLSLGCKNHQDAQLQLQAQPSRESVDSAIGDVLSKPWLPLPLGLKPPSMDSVMGELQRQGVANVPPACG